MEINRQWFCAVAVVGIFLYLKRGLVFNPFAGQVLYVRQKPG
jgi:hypothetical protein